MVADNAQVSEVKTESRPLIETNPYLRDPEKRMAMLERNAYESCRFEGARGLKRVSTSTAKPTQRKAAKKKTSPSP